MKIAQVVMIPVVHFRAMETDKDNLYSWYPISMSERGEGALGSTDNPDRRAASIDPFSLPQTWELGDTLK